MSGIRRSGNRPKLAKHLRKTSEKAHLNRTKEDRDREHAATDAWAERQRLANLPNLPSTTERKEDP